MRENERVFRSLGEVRELQRFIHTLVMKVPRNQQVPGTDVLKVSKRHGIETPKFLRDAELQWAREADVEADFRDVEPLVFVQPGHPGMLGLTIGCIRISKACVACLECGWLYCRLVLRCSF